MRGTDKLRQEIKMELKQLSALERGKKIAAGEVKVKEAVDAARKAAVEGDIVLLSPATSSFDQYSGFEERGRHFKQLVNAL